MNLYNQLESFNSHIQQEGWRMDVRMEANSTILKNGLKYMEDNQDLLLAICLNNGYYKRENIYRMLKFALNLSKRVQIFTTDGPAKHNYLALGKSEVEAIRETRLNKNRLQNLCAIGLERINATLPENARYTLTYMKWEDIYIDKAYLDSYAQIKELYANSAEFKKDIQETSRQVLLNRIGIQSQVESVLSVGIEYIFEELAFILSYSSLGAGTKPISDHGKNGFNYIYYESWPVFEKLVNGEYDNQPKEEIGFVIAKIVDDQGAISAVL